MNILIIADRPQLFNSLQKFLSQNNCSVFLCGKQRDILSLIKKKDIRIIIMDLTLKEIQDFALLKLIKSFDPLMDV
ncbi:MAG TPA: response regulator, partial [Candidatus Aminicenantes bacterium]|nr:response regulator [Candidatus Aminicenantes bacterium]